MTTRIVGVLLVSALIACHRDQPRQADPSGAALLAAAAPQDTAFAGTTASVHRARPIRPGVPPALLRAVVTGAVRRCGSGDPVALAGAGRLVVRFEPARAHDERGNPSPAERERATRLPAVKDMKLVCDFEGQVEWVLGVAAVSPYRVSETTG